MSKRLSRFASCVLVTSALAGCGKDSNPGGGSPGLSHAEWVDGASCEGNAEFTVNPPVDFEREMVIRNIQVVNDPCRTAWGGCTSPSEGKWTAGYLLWQIAGGLGSDVNHPSTKRLVESWFSSWLKDQAVPVTDRESRTAKARFGMLPLVLCPWYLDSIGDPRASCPVSWTRAHWDQLDMKKAPFRLLAIVNRLDMAGTGYGPGAGLGNPGEVRFVFGFLGVAGDPLDGTVIFEYQATQADSSDATAVARAWHELSSLSFGPDYNRKLEALTERFARFPVATGDHRGVVSNIRQVRTNELFAGLVPSVWEFREFHQSATDASRLPDVAEYVYPLQLAPLSQTMDNSLNESLTLCSFFQQNLQSILAESHRVPAKDLAVASYISSGIRASAFWKVNEADCIFGSTKLQRQQVRHRFALGTCIGCHYVETGTDQVHIKPRYSGTEAELSTFVSKGATADGYWKPFDFEPGYTEKFNERYRRTCELRRVIAGLRTNPLFRPSGASPH